jgi:DNA-binding transcriptional regulator LsrR (DeoR family)
MARIDELRLITKVAHLYHERNLKQSDIAEQLDLSQATVSRLLKRAKKEEIVRTVVSIPPGAYPDLEEKLQCLYNLKDAVVVDCANDDDPIREIGAAAAYYLETSLKQKEVIGISSWSGTLLATVDAMHPLSRSIAARVIQILGGVGNPSAEVHAARLTGRLAALVNGETVFLPAPGVVGSADSMRVLLDDQFVQESLALFDQITLALVGVGSVSPSHLLASSGNVFSSEELDVLRQHGAVGDVCLRFFDQAGKPVVTPLNERVIGIGLEQLKRVDRSVGIAGGRRKHKAIRGALTGGWINVLITDRFTAESLVDGSGE